MKVKHLIELLSLHDPERMVVLSSDAEGNSYAPVCTVDGNLVYLDGEIFLQELRASDVRAGYSEEDTTDDPAAIPALCIWP